MFSLASSLRLWISLFLMPAALLFLRRVPRSTTKRESSDVVTNESHEGRDDAEDWEMYSEPDSLVCTFRSCDVDGEGRPTTPPRPLPG